MRRSFAAELCRFVLTLSHTRKNSVCPIENYTQSILVTSIPAIPFLFFRFVRRKYETDESLSALSNLMLKACSS